MNTEVGTVGQSDKTAGISGATDGQKFRDCKTGKLFKMKRVDGAMVILEISDGEGDRREVDILSSLLSVFYHSERRRARDEDEKDTIIRVGHRGLDDPAHDPLGKRSYPVRVFK
jgi:hypothetical protein